MGNPFSRYRAGGCGIAVLCVLGLGAPAATAAAQIGAIGAVPAAAGTDGIFAGAPIFTESAAVLPRGRLSAGAYFAAVSQSLGIQGAPVDVTVSQLLAGVSFSPVDGLMLGVRASPYIQLEASSAFGSVQESGRGDAHLDARYQLWRAPGGRTQLAANASLQLPTGDDRFGAAGAAVAAGAALSQQINRFGLHGAVGAAVPFDDADGETTLSVSAAGVLGVSPRIWVSLEMIGAVAGGEHLVNLAPAARFGIGQRVFLDAGVLLNAVTSLGQAPFDHAIVVGINVVP